MNVMMKYFSLDGWIRDQDVQSFHPEPVVRAVEGYKRYLGSIKSRLPDDLRAVAGRVLLA